MIDMFTSYQNLSENYIPNNLAKDKRIPCSYTKLNPCELTRPYELYNAKNELEGYYWYYGNTINLEFEIDGEVLDIQGNGTGEYVPAAEYLADKIATISIYNFRMETIYTKSIQASENLLIEIDSELSKKLLKGIYYCSLEISNSKSHETIFNAADCKFLVK